MTSVICIQIIMVVFLFTYQSVEEMLLYSYHRDEWEMWEEEFEYIRKLAAEEAYRSSKKYVADRMTLASFFSRFGAYGWRGL